jgi:hypothetical protein
MLEQALHNKEAMFDFCAHTSFSLLQLFAGTLQRIRLERRAHARAHYDVPVDCDVRVFRSLPLHLKRIAL